MNSIVPAVLPEPPVVWAPEPLLPHAASSGMANAPAPAASPPRSRFRRVIARSRSSRSRSILSSPGMTCPSAGERDKADERRSQERPGHRRRERLRCTDHLRATEHMRGQGSAGWGTKLCIDLRWLGQYFRGTVRARARDRGESVPPPGTFNAKQVPVTVGCAEGDQADPQRRHPHPTGSTSRLCSGPGAGIALSGTADASPTTRAAAATATSGPRAGATRGYVLPEIAAMFSPPGHLHSPRAARH